MTDFGKRLQLKLGRGVYVVFGGLDHREDRQRRNGRGKSRPGLGARDEERNKQETKKRIMRVAPLTQKIRNESQRSDRCDSLSRKKETRTGLFNMISCECVL